MKTTRDFLCHNCGELLENHYGECGDNPSCPECGTEMEFLPTKLNANTYFPGSHNSEYGTHGRKFQGCTKEQLLKPIDDYRNAKKKKYQEGK